jgi:hypothetical protein
MSLVLDCKKVRSEWPGDVEDKLPGGFTDLKGHRIHQESGNCEAYRRCWTSVGQMELASSHQEISQQVRI